MTGRLVIYSSAPAQQRADGLWLDAKFVQGMERHVAEWPGPVSVVLRDAGLPLPFGVHCPPGSLGFDLAIVPRRAAVAPHLGRDVALLAAAADDHEALDFPALAQALGAKLVYVLEYTLGTRLRIVWMDRTRNPLRRARSALWTLQQERRLRRALRVADAVQFNGYPAYDAYRGLVRDAHLYLDNRLSAAMLATAPEMTARAERLRSGAPLRLIHSGRLEPMKGAQDLLPVMDALATRGGWMPRWIFTARAVWKGIYGRGWTVSAGACGCTLRSISRANWCRSTAVGPMCSCPATASQTRPAPIWKQWAAAWRWPGSTMPCGAGSRPAAAAARWRSWAMSPRWPMWLRAGTMTATP